MTPEELYEKLRSLQEPKGYYFNKDKAFVLDLLESLLINRDRYGYMACPCSQSLTTDKGAKHGPPKKDRHARPDRAPNPDRWHHRALELPTWQATGIHA